MEEETAQPFFFRGRWRGRKLWILICASFLAITAVFLLVWINPSSENGAGQASAAQQEAAQLEAPEETANQAPSDTTSGQTQEPAVQDSGEQPSITPGTGENAPGMVVEFPDPTGSGPATPPPGGYTDIRGPWILDMTGYAYGLTNCHIILNEDGTISSPPDYDQVFQIAASTYTWQEGSPAFSASLQLMLKMGSGQVLIPVQVELVGNAAESMLEITGDFTAEPQGEVYAPYAQQGDFIMHR
jgi:hypothetical protein